MAAIELGSMVSAIKFLFEVIKGGIGASKAQKKSFFEDHVKPSYADLVEIDRDYKEQFKVALDVLKKRSDLEKAVVILKRERPAHLLERQAVRENLLALREYSLTKARKPKFILLFFDYAYAAQEYLGAASPLSSLPVKTWYTHFIDEFSKLVEEQYDPFDHDYVCIAQGRRAPDIAIGKLEDAIFKRMPEAMQEVQAAYAKLRVECLTDY